ncbi:stemmadenine O-acetyltransferase-like [Euphorbia lathyris]|uniref:stemmadenine O-acetyltransferase-like n=1 Tax=Euphorbia lathyris TaxID=212925 RepID=UPI003313A775
MATKSIEITHKETIRPSSPTPHTHKTLKLSLIDQFMPETYTPIVLFYSGDSEEDREKKSEKLRTSLAETLTQFYPLTGRLKDNSVIECEDQGALYVEAQIGCSLSDILKKPEAGSLDQFLPAAIESSESVTGSLLLVQATFFACGGLAIGVCISHKIADAATLAQFIKFWSRIAIGSEVDAPVFLADSMFSPIEFSAPEKSVQMQYTKCITKRFVFAGSKIGALKELASSTVAPKPTRVEAVSGLIWKGVITALKKSNPNLTRPSVWSVSVNLRPRFTPPVPENHAGNLVVIVTPKVEEVTELKDLVGVIKEEMQEFVEHYVKKLQGEDGVEAICEFGREFARKALSGDIDFFMCSAWCRFGLYDADFGWRKPVWLSIVSTNIRNVCILLDTKDGEGFEAWITLSEEEMFWFESDEQVLQFSEVNPSVIV